MDVKEKLLQDLGALETNGPVNIVIFGDSVSHGFLVEDVDYENVYWNRLKKKLNAFRDQIPVNMINAAIGGTTDAASLKRMETQVLRHDPDLVIICFGLNDVGGPLEVYLDSLKQIFQKCLDKGCDAIFMTPNMLNTYVALDTPAEHLDYAHVTANFQTCGRMDRYMDGAVKLAAEMGIPVCDCYAAWKKLAETEDTTLLLANRINHPTAEMHKLFADMLYPMIIKESI
jgi:lysophospholipase L1-like esterase